MRDWKETAIARRDERQTKVPDVRRPGGSKKDTKRWCRGKLGVKHNTKCVAYDEWESRGTGSDFSKEWKLLVCLECEKQLDYWWPWRGDRSLPPEWVITA